MGKSDPYIFNFYLNNFPIQKVYNKAAFFGQAKDNGFTSLISCKSKNFYDLSKKNWNINSFPYKIEKDKKFDLVVCTRCAYFSKHPKKMIESFSKILKKDGILFIDWGLGDHWRFKDYVVGWKKGDQHEWAYEEDNFLWSSVWEESFLKNKQVELFSKHIEKFGYNNLPETVEKEVPRKISLEEIKSYNFTVENQDFLFLWPDKPQLYIKLILKKELHEK